jgi:hypothetical protein
MKTKSNSEMENTIQELGFKFVKQYKHGEFITNRYKKGFLEVEFTYNSDNTLRTLDITIDEVNFLPVNVEELKILDSILNKELK